MFVFLFQAEDGIRELVRSRGLGDVYKRQMSMTEPSGLTRPRRLAPKKAWGPGGVLGISRKRACLLYTSDAADERSSVDLGGRRIINKKTQTDNRCLLSLMNIPTDMPNI